MRHRGDRFLRDARRRGDRYAENNLRRAILPLWLAADDVDKAEAELEILGPIPERLADYEVQTWYTMETMGELALYQGQLHGARQMIERKLTLASLRAYRRQNQLARYEVVRSLAPRETLAQAQRSAQQPQIGRAHV